MEFDIRVVEPFDDVGRAEFLIANQIMLFWFEKFGLLYLGSQFSVFRIRVTVPRFQIFSF